MRVGIGIRLLGHGGAVVLLGLAVACSTSNSPGSSDASATTATSSSMTSAGPVKTPADLAKQSAVLAYVGMWRDYARAASTADWQSPGLAQFATGAALSTLSRGLYADHYGGV